MRINRVTLAAELARRDWGNKRLGELAGLSAATLSAVRGGKSVYPITAMKIAEALNIPLERLIEKEMMK